MKLVRTLILDVLLRLLRKFTNDKISIWIGNRGRSWSLPSNLILASLSGSRCPLVNDEEVYSAWTRFKIPTVVTER